MLPAWMESAPCVLAVLVNVPVVVRLLFTNDRVPEAVVMLSVPIVSEPTFPPDEVYCIQAVVLVSTTSCPGNEVHK